MNIAYAGDEIWDTIAAGLNGYILVFGEVNSCVASAKQLQLRPLVAR